MGNSQEYLVEWIIIDSIFIIASITDKLDGYLARKNHQVTAFGKFLDPLADKILVLAAMMMLVEMQKLPAWIPVIVLAREFVVSGYRLIAVEQGGEVIAASKWGKLKTLTQMIAIILSIFRLKCIRRMFYRNIAGRRLNTKLSSNNNDDNTSNSNNIFWSGLLKRSKEIYKSKINIRKNKNKNTLKIK